MTAPPRDDLYNAIDARVERMIGAGAVEEVELFLATDPQPDFPLLKAVGVLPISEFIEGTIDRDHMAELCKRDTRRYAKRQTTWFRHQIIPEITINMKLSKQILVVSLLLLPLDKHQFDPLPKNLVLNKVYFDKYQMIK